MQVAFPHPIGVRISKPKLSGLRQSPFTNIDGETFGTPALNGFWRLHLEFQAVGEQARLAASVFVTQMEAAGATCVVPIKNHSRPNDSNGRMLVGGNVVSEYTFDHVGFLNSPFDGYTLRSAASHRDSYIDVNKPALSQLWPGHYITLDDRLYQVTNVSAIDESETAIRVSVMPNIRGNHNSGKTVIVDQLRLNCRLDSGDQVGASIEVVKTGTLSFVEAF